MELKALYIFILPFTIFKTQDEAGPKLFSQYKFKCSIIQLQLNKQFFITCMVPIPE
jgi:hypothetical protein